MNARRAPLCLKAMDLSSAKVSQWQGMNSSKVDGTVHQTITAKMQCKIPELARSHCPMVIKYQPKKQIKNIVVTIKNRKL